MSTLPTPVGATSGAAVVLTVDIPGITANVQIANTNAINAYHNTAVPDWLAQYGQQTTAQRPAWLAANPPPTITVESLNTALLTSLLLTFNSELNAAQGVLTVPPLDLSSAYTPSAYPIDPRLTAALIAAPVSPTDPVGAYQGNNVYAEVPGDTNPLGFITPVGDDPRGQFVKVGTLTPWGIMGAGYVLVSATH